MYWQTKNSGNLQLHIMPCMYMAYVTVAIRQNEKNHLVNSPYFFKNKKVYIKLGIYV